VYLTHFSTGIKGLPRSDVTTWDQNPVSTIRWQWQHCNLPDGVALETSEAECLSRESSALPLIDRVAADNGPNDFDVLNLCLVYRMQIV